MEPARDPPKRMSRVSCCDIGRVIGLTFLVLFFLIIWRISQAVRLEVADAAVRMFESNSQPMLPDTLRGVIWMAGNIAPELITTLEAGSYDEATRSISHPFGLEYGWSYSTSSLGWLEYIFVCWSYSWGGVGRLHFDFDANWTYADLYLKVYGVQAGHWYMQQMDDEGHAWVRGEFASDGSKVVAYSIKKVIDHSGAKLPAFEEMVAVTQSGTFVRDIPDIERINMTELMPKTRQQIMTGPRSRAAPVCVGVALLLAFLVVFAACIRCCLVEHGLARRRKPEARSTAGILVEI